MIVSAKNDYFRLSRQRALKALRQGHSGKTAAYNHDRSRLLRHGGVSVLHGWPC
jgi:hypothetical protein